MNKQPKQVDLLQVVTTELNMRIQGFHIANRDLLNAINLVFTQQKARITQLEEEVEKLEKELKKK